MLKIEGERMPSYFIMRLVIHFEDELAVIIRFATKLGWR